MPTQTSKLVKDLTKVPNIVGGLGLSVAAAQKAFNLDYMENVERLLAVAGILLGEKRLENNAAVPVPDGEKGKLSAFAAVFKDLLCALAPSRYQFTETTLTVRLDLAQTMDMSADVGLGVGYGGIALNASVAVGYGYDYRAAAECRTVIQAVPADQTVFKALLERAAQLGEKVLELPPGAEVDDRIIEQARTLFEKMTEMEPLKVKEVR